MPSQGQTTGLDLIQAAGYFYAYDATFDVAVTQGPLDLRWTATVDIATVSAIQVLGLQPLVTPTPTPTLFPGGLDLPLNTGGGAVTDNTGKVWYPDQPYNPSRGNNYGYTIPGSAYHTSGSIDRTDVPALYQDWRDNGVLDYKFNLPNGLYTVVLTGAELAYDQPGERLMNVIFNGSTSSSSSGQGSSPQGGVTVLANFDVVAEGGYASALDEAIRDVPVTGGLLDVNLASPNASAFLSAVEIIGEQLAPTPTFTPTITPTPLPPPCVALSQEWTGNLIAPVGIAQLPGGNWVVADNIDNLLDVLDPSGNPVTTLDPTYTSAGPFNGPLGVAVSPASVIYIADSGNGRVLALNPDGSLAGTITGTGSSALVNPQGVALDSSGNVYVSDAALNQVLEFISTGTFVRFIGLGPGSGQGQFNNPMGLAVDADGTVYVADSLNARVEVFNAQGNYLNAFTGTSFQPVGLALDPEGSKAHRRRVRQAHRRRVRQAHRRRVRVGGGPGHRAGPGLRQGRELPGVRGKPGLRTGPTPGYPGGGLGWPGRGLRDRRPQRHGGPVPALRFGFHDPDGHRNPHRHPDPKRHPHPDPGLEPANPAGEGSDRNGDAPGGGRGASDRARERDRGGPGREFRLI